jgi:hypothetical protein
MYGGAVLLPDTEPDMPGTLAAGSLAARITRSPRAHARAISSSATSVTLSGPLVRLLASSRLLHWFVNRQWLIHRFAANLRGPAQPLAFAGAPLRAVIPHPGHHRQCPPVSAGRGAAEAWGGRLGQGAAEVVQEPRISVRRVGEAKVDGGGAAGHDAPLP